MNAIDRVIAARKSRRRSVVVPEWDNLEVWVSPVTPADQNAVSARQPKTAEDRIVLLVALKAESEDGKPLFRLGDVPLLTQHADVVALNRIYDTMLGLIEEAKPAERTPEQVEADKVAADKMVDGAEAKIEADPPSASV